MSEKSRVRWLCRRGMKELDVLLERFVRSDYDSLSEHQHDEFVRLLHHEDPDLWMLMMGRAEPENEEQGALLQRIREFQRPPSV
ncbi:succinate dehydrogenase assembly factor 2 [Salinisphaera sp.]|uniref:FAD assembly factor SdhE n=1 Tax=Salinisphaera sp. TaxID=1914330 RepID=UPI002D7742DC|nr:succinate dehydrogenase assembly factor 2 [Salinisphaera sp.]HET7314870.1 succinate dehydrogenase assembly factor 2 [Salinisphaera sp.]